MNGDLPVSEDEFLSGRIRVLQPRRGFRAGIDTVLLAAGVDEASTNIAEFGAGSGIASCCVLADLPQASATLVDFDETALLLAERNLRKNSFSSRARILLLDVMQKGSEREKAGLKNDFYSSIIANPPFFDAGAGTVSPLDSRAGSRHMQNDDLDKWVRSAASSAAPGGEIIFIHSVAALPRLLASFGTRFGRICILPIVPRPGHDATRVLIRGIKGSRAPISLLSPLVLHEEKGNGFLPQAEAIFRGKSRISWKNSP